MQFAVKLEDGSDTPIYKALSEQLKQGIQSGELKTGEVLPSTRQLAASLRISRFTVCKSYEELLSQGYLASVRGKGTVVSAGQTSWDFTPPAVPQAPTEIAIDRLSSYGKRLLEADAIEPMNAELHPELSYHWPPAEQIPLKTWRKFVHKNSRSTDSPGLVQVIDALGYPPLRDELSAYVRRARGARCDADQIAVVSNLQQGIDIVARILVEPGDWVAVENPGYPFARRSILSAGGRLIPIPVDEEGIVVRELAALQQKIKLVYVSPSHNDPTGAVMSLSRRRELIEWAKETGAYILEDDFDYEFRYGGRPAPSLQGLDDSGSVIYLANFRRILFPVVRLGFLVLPKGLVEAVKCAKSLVERDMPMLEQCVLTDFISEGLLEKYIRRQFSIYLKRRQALIRACMTHLGKRIQISKESSSTHLLVRFNVPISDEAIASCAKDAGVAVVSTESYYLGEAKPGEFLMPFAHLEPDTVDKSVSKFAELIQSSV